MKWDTPKYYESWERRPGMPAEGETREYLHFAILPIKCEDGKTRWLETVKVTEVFGKCFYGIRGCYTWNWRARSVEGIK